MKKIGRCAVGLMMIAAIYMGASQIVQASAREGHAVLPVEETKQEMKKKPPHLEMAKLTAIRAWQGEGASRVVLDITPKRAYWDVEYNPKNYVLTLYVPDTKNAMTQPISYKGKGTGVLKGVRTDLQQGDRLAIHLQAKSPVQHNIFALENPDRLVVDLFTSYSQKMEKTVTEHMLFSKSDVAGEAGRLRIYRFIADEKIAFQMLRSAEAGDMKEWRDSVSARVLVPIAGDLLAKAYAKPVKENISLERHAEGWRLHASEDKKSGAILKGAWILKDGQYVGPTGYDGEAARPSALYVATDKKGRLQVILIEGGSPESVGESFVETSQRFLKEGIVSALCIARGRDAKFLLDAVVYPREVGNDASRYQQMMGLE